jgi:hypothetical protein
LFALTAKQVAQQIAQRAAFLVDQAIQEKVGHIFRSMETSLLLPKQLQPIFLLFSNPSSSERREKRDPPNSSVKQFAQTRVSCNCVDWKLPGTSQPC